MRRFWRALHRLAMSAHLHMSVGLLVVAAGTWEFVHSGLQEERHLLAHASFGIVLLGVTRILEGAEHMIKGVRMAGLAIIEEAQRAPRGRLLLSRRILTNHYFEMALGVLVLAAGLAELIEDCCGGIADSDDFVWHLGLAVLGLFEVVKGLAGALAARDLADRAGIDGDRAEAFMKRLDRLLRTPHAGVAVATLLVAAGVWEEVYFEASGTDTVWMEAHLGMILHAVHMMAMSLPAIFLGIDLVEGAAPEAEPRRGAGTGRAGAVRA